MEKVKKRRINKDAIKQSDYQNVLHELKEIIIRGENRAYKAVDNIKVQIYWQIGERIVREELKNKDRAEYGKYLIDNLAGDLEISRRLLYQIYGFYKVYPIVQTLSAQLSWSHYVELIELSDEKERIFYENRIINNSWSIRELRESIKNQLYQKTSEKEIDEISKTKLPAVIDLQKIFKPGYDFNFLEIAPNHFEKELEDRILHSLRRFS